MSNKNQLNVKNSNGGILIEVPDDFAGTIKITQKGVVVFESTLPQGATKTGDSSNPNQPPPPPPH